MNNILIFDVDGTLDDKSNGQNPDFAIFSQMLRNLKKAGCIIVFATGRTYLHFEEFYINFSKSQKIEELVDCLIYEDGHRFLKEGTNFEIGTANSLAQMHQLRNYIANYISTSFQEAKITFCYPEDKYKGETYIILDYFCQYNDSPFDLVENFFNQALDSDLFSVKVLNGYCSVYLREANKASSFLQTGIDLQSKTIFCCDDQNDVKLAQVVKASGGFIVCPQNAINDIKSMSDYISQQPYFYGITEYLNKL
jgi:hydroxymethylpyrimidine pyrophosphatase-like HAD family hydrolase